MATDFGREAREEDEFVVRSPSTRPGGITVGEVCDVGFCIETGLVTYPVWIGIPATVNVTGARTFGSKTGIHTHRVWIILYRTVKVLAILSGPGLGVIIITRDVTFCNTTCSHKAS